MKYGFSTLGCPDWAWEDILTTASDLGFDGIELRGVGKEIYLPNSKIFSGDGITSAKNSLKRLNLSISCLTTGAFLFDMSLMDTARKEVEDYIKLAVALNAPYVRVLADRDPAPGPVDEEAVEENLRALLPVAEKAGVVLLVETNGIYANSQKLKSLCEKINHPSLGVLWDIHHPHRFFGEDARQTFDNLSKYIKHVHVKDSVMTDGKVTYRMTGYGDVPVSEAMTILRDNGYEGFVVLEWVKRWNMNLEEPGIVIPHFINSIKL